MITKTAIAAAAIATAIAATPASVANAGSVGFSFGIQTDQGSFYFGDGPRHGHGWGHGPRAYSCQDARRTLRWDFRRVRRVECNGSTYTFRVRNHGGWRTVKFNKWNGNYWFA